MSTAVSGQVNGNYTHVRSSGYLAPKYRYRNPPATMSWLEEDLDLDNIEGNNRPESPEPQLDDFIQKVLQNKRVPITRRKENAYKSALYLASNIVEAAFDLEWLYPKYIRKKERMPEICDFRAVDKNVYVGLVPLRKPIRPDSLTVAYRSPGELPTHRMLVHVNKNITKEERLNVMDEWGHCLDSKRYLRPDFVLNWFNEGLTKACEKIEVENKRTQKHAFLETSLADDGTVWVHIIGFDPQDNYKLNIVPCLPISEVPKQFKLSAPIPSRRPYNDSHGKFLQEVHCSIKSGEEIIFLEARLEKVSSSNPMIEITWGMQIGQLEDRAFAFINSLTSTRVFEDMIILINAIKDEHTFCLHAITNKVINHAMFFQYRKSLGKLTRTQDWFMAVLESIQAQMHLNVFPNFFLQKQNIFVDTDCEVLKFYENELKRLIQCLKDNPDSLCSYSGCEESPKTEQSEKTDDDTNEDSKENDEMNEVSKEQSSGRSVVKFAD